MKTSTVIVILAYMTVGWFTGVYATNRYGHCGNKGVGITAFILWPAFWTLHSINLASSYKPDSVCAGLNN